MNSTKVSIRISQHLQLLGFEKSDILPNIKDLRKAFFSSARHNHPDKNSNLDINAKKKKEEHFKEILNAFNEVAEEIFSQLSNEEPGEEEEFEDMEEDFDDDEEWFDELIYMKEECEEVNIVETNLQSFTIKIPQHHTDAWDEILTAHIGNKCDRSAKSNGIQYNKT